MKKADAVLLCWYPGAQGGRAAADILLGKVSPSGKLPVTFYRNEQLDSMPAFTDYRMVNRTYRYFEDTPLYPFGYGLSYGDVRVTGVQKEKGPDGWTLTASLTNRGSMDTDEVVQVYCENEGSKNAPLHPRLVAFRRVHVPAGEEAAVTLRVTADAALVVNEQGEKVPEGKAVFHVGLGQPDQLTRKLTGKDSVRIEV